MPSYSGLYDGVYGTPYALLPLSRSMGNARTLAGRMMGRESYGRANWRGQLVALNGAVAGGLAFVQHKRVKWTPDRGASATGGGLVDLQTFDDINRVTTAADRSNIDTMWNYSTKPQYPKDRSGNGGGSKLGF
jgi:hypothetical protein